MVVIVKYLNGRKNIYRNIETVLIDKDGNLQMKEITGLHRRFKLESFDYYFCDEEN